MTVTLPLVGGEVIPGGMGSRPLAIDSESSRMNDALAGTMLSTNRGACASSEGFGAA